jgi:glycosyltransferase involved in cell wall biosynthesis
MRGGEKVLLELLRLFPDADLFTLFYRPGAIPPEIENRIRGCSFLQRSPDIWNHYRHCLPLFPAAIRSIDLSGYDRIISSSHAVAKSVRVSRGAIHVSYVHTPMRYAWETRSEYFHFGRYRRCKQAALQALVPWLRWFDRRTASSVHTFIANSENVRGRIRRAYGVDSRVIYPPIRTDFFTPADQTVPGDYYLVVSSLEPYKRIDLAVRAFSGGSRPLLVAGTGTLAEELRRIARPPVEFLGWVSDQRLRDLYRHCRALVFPGLEDFGLVPVEAQACGRPVICYGQGGAPESVQDGVSGIYFFRQSTDALLEAVERAESIDWRPGEIRGASLRFSDEAFRTAFTNLWLELESDLPAQAA